MTSYCQAQVSFHELGFNGNLILGAFAGLVWSAWLILCPSASYWWLRMLLEGQMELTQPLPPGASRPGRNLLQVGAKSTSSTRCLWWDLHCWCLWLWEKILKPCREEQCYALWAGTTFCGVIPLSNTASRLISLGGEVKGFLRQKKKKKLQQ